MINQYVELRHLLSRWSKKKQFGNWSTLVALFDDYDLLAITRWLWLHDYITMTLLSYVIWLVYIYIYIYTYDHRWRWLRLFPTPIDRFRKKLPGPHSAKAWQPTVAGAAWYKRFGQFRHRISFLTSMINWTWHFSTLRTSHILIFLIGLDYLVWNIGKNQVEITCDGHVWPC